MAHPNVIASVRSALGAIGKPSSDFDLNLNIVLPEGRQLRAASVLVAIVIRDDVPQVILTKRSSALKHHPGQIAFPGGKQEEGDADVIAAALREADEEIGLPAAHVEVLGTLPQHETVTGFQVTPVVGFIKDPFEIRPEPGEVDEVFHVPLSHVLNNANYGIQSRRWRGQQRAYFAVPFGSYYIWGATARMLRSWSELMT